MSGKDKDQPKSTDERVKDKATKDGEKATDRLIQDLKKKK